MGMIYMKKVCIISADDEETALKVMHDFITPKLKGECVLIHKYSERTLCNDDAVIYEGSRHTK